MKNSQPHWERLPHKKTGGSILYNCYLGTQWGGKRVRRTQRVKGYVCEGGKQKSSRRGHEKSKVSRGKTERSKERKTLGVTRGVQTFNKEITGRPEAKKSFGGKESQQRPSRKNQLTHEKRIRWPLTGGHRVWGKGRAGSLTDKGKREIRRDERAMMVRTHMLPNVDPARRQYTKSRKSQENTKENWDGSKSHWKTGCHRK